MARVVVFPDQESFHRAVRLGPRDGLLVEPLTIPSFCLGLAPPSLVISGNTARFIDELHQEAIPVSGVLAYYPFKREIPQAPPLDSRWRYILGDLRVSSVSSSLSDPTRLRIDAVPSRALGDLIPIMARFIRGGAYQPAARILAFEEESRLLVFSSERFSISRADDLLDAWIMLRCAVELICNAWEHRRTIEPDLEPRQGLGASEIFRRLPGSNCGRCGYGSCMEFALCVFGGRLRAEDCVELAEDGEPRGLESLRWLLRVIGVATHGEVSGSGALFGDRASNRVVSSHSIHHSGSSASSPKAEPGRCPHS